jgi:hypothetical protein
MSELDALQFVVVKFPVFLSVFAVLGSMVVIGQVIVAATPNKADDEAWAKLQGFPVIGKLLLALTNFAVIQKK